VAIAGLLLLQVPPAVASASVVVSPTQTLLAPVIAAGCGLTVIALLVEQPPGSVYIILVEPGVPPVTTPVLPTTEAVPDAALLQVPPVTELAKVVVSVEHTVDAPVIAAGTGFTVNGVDTAQPVGSVNVMVTVPAEFPVTTPVPEPTDASVGLLLLHVELPEPSVSVVVDPTHTLVVPPIAEGSALTVNGVLAKQPVEGMV